MQSSSQIVTINKQTNQHPTFYRPDALPVVQPTVSKHWRENITFHGLAHPKLAWGLPTLSLTLIAPGYLRGWMPCLSALLCQYPILSDICTIHTCVINQNKSKNNLSTQNWQIFRSIQYSASIHYTIITWSACISIMNAFLLHDASCSPSRKLAINSGASGIKKSKFLKNKLHWTELAVVCCTVKVKHYSNVQSNAKRYGSPKTLLRFSCTIRFSTAV